MTPPVPVTWNAPRRRRAWTIAPAGWAAAARALAALTALYFILRSLIAHG